MGRRLLLQQPKSGCICLAYEGVFFCRSHSGDCNHQGRWIPFFNQAALRNSDLCPEPFRLNQSRLIPQMRTGSAIKYARDNKYRIRISRSTFLQVPVAGKKQYTTEHPQNCRLHDTARKNFGSQISAGPFGRQNQSLG